MIDKYLLDKIPSRITFKLAYLQILNLQEGFPDISIHNESIITSEYQKFILHAYDKLKEEVWESNQDLSNSKNEEL